MKLQNLTIIFIIIVLPVILLTTFYISTGLKTLRYQALYDTGLITATQDAIQAFELNSLNNKYSDNPETKRSIIKSSVKMLETSLCNTCNISSYNTDEIEEYIPAIMFGLSDGFYVYAPSYNPKTLKYEHSLKNYVYYSEMLDDDNGIVIRYYLDSYVQISGYFKKDMASPDKEYCSKEGYLINIAQTTIEGGLISPSKITYYGTEIDMNDQLAVNYFVDNYEFSEWFKSALDGIAPEYLKIDKDNDPEDPESEFSKHKKELIKSKIEGVLNSTITAYSERTHKQEYKMPKLSEEDWEKIYTDVSVTTFFQGKKIGLTKYNGYCVLNSNNHYETINPNLLYFSTDDDTSKSINTTSDYYHDIRCSEIKDMRDITIDIGDKDIKTLRGFRIGRFQKLNITDEATEYDSTSTEVTTEKTYNKYSKYMYERAELACYSCINGTVGNISVYDYIAVANSGSHTGNTTNPFIKRSYWTSLARERAKLHNKENKESNISVDKKVNGVEKATIINGETVTYTITITNNALTTDYIRKIEDIFDDNNIKIIKESIQYEKGGSRVAVDDGVYSELSHSGVKWEWSTELGEGFTIGPGEKIVITYKAKVYGSVGYTVENTVKVLPGYSEDDIEKSAECIIRASDLTVEKKINGQDYYTVKYGEKVTYTINITNNGAYTEIVDIIDKWDNGVEPIESTITPVAIKGKNYACDSVNKTITFNSVTIDSKEQVSFTFEAYIKGDIGSSIKNKASVYVPSDKTTVIKEVETEATINAKIKKQHVNAGNYHVILVLDNSGSMTGNIENVRSACVELVKALGLDVVENADGSTKKMTDNEIENKSFDNITIVSFAQGTDEKSKINEYKLAGNGISTNYLGGLTKAYSKLRVNVNNYVVFMSDGGPTNTQTTAFNGDDDKWDATDDSDSSVLQLLKQVINVIKNGLEWLFEFLFNNLVQTFGGWIECIWYYGDGSSTDHFGYRLLVTADFDWKIDIGVIRGVWVDQIMPARNKLENACRKMYTVYFDTSTSGNDEEPWYGLKKMASSFDDSYTSKNVSGLEDNFKQIAADIKRKEEGSEIDLTTSKLQLDTIDNIDNIQIGEETYRGEIFINALKSNAVDGVIDVNKFEYNGKKIFQTSEDIIITYKEL